MNLYQLNKQFPIGTKFHSKRDIIEPLKFIVSSYAFDEIKNKYIVIGKLYNDKNHEWVFNVEDIYAAK